MMSGSDSNKEKKLFGIYHEVTLLFLGFLLTTLVGGSLTYWYQKLAWDRDDLSKKKQEELSRAGAVFDDVSRLLDKRLYRLRKLEWAIEEGSSPSELISLRKQYQAVVSDWNENLNRNLALTDRYFGPELRQELEGSITEGFRNLHSELTKVLRDPSHKGLQQLKKDTDDFNPRIYAYNLRMLEPIQRGEVGAFLVKASFSKH